MDQLSECSESLNFESFFNNNPNDPPLTKKLWIRLSKCQLEEAMAAQVILEAPFNKKGKRTKIWKTRYYTLTNEFIAYKDKLQSKSLQKIMSFDKLKLEYVKIEAKGAPIMHGLKFIKNNKTTTLYTSNNIIYEAFRKELDSRCILHSFKDKYKIEKMIGKGSFGKVYLIRRRTDDKMFAAKMFFKDALLKQKKGKESLFNEVAVLKTLDHPGLMKIYEVHETALSIFLVIELLEGGELFGRLKEKGNYSEKDCILMLSRIMESLNYIHNRGIMHRDIKPENLILRSKSNDYDIVIADFGLAEQTSKQFIHLRCGTPGYVAPEVLSCRGATLDYTTKCDVFSLGCVFYYIVSGKNPFHSKYRREMFTLNRECVISFDDPKIRSLSPAAQGLLQSMLEKDPNKRPSIKECLAHEFFVKSHERRTSAIVLSFRKTTVMYMADPSRERSIQGSYEDTISFFIGRTNIVRGMIDTVNDVSLSGGADAFKTYELPGIERTQVIRTTYMRVAKREESLMLTPFKQSSSRLQELVQRKSKFASDESSNQSSSHSEELGTFNSEEDENEAFQRRKCFLSKISSVMNNGMMVNPFTDFEKIDENNSLQNTMKSMNSIANKLNLHNLSVINQKMQ